MAMVFDVNRTTLAAGVAFDTAMEQKLSALEPAISMIHDCQVTAYCVGVSAIERSYDLPPFFLFVFEGKRNRLVFPMRESQRTNRKVDLALQECPMSRKKPYCF